MKQTPEEAELLVIGGGPGGYVAAIRAAQLGQDVVLVEKSGVGGVCLNHGCIPSKALITATKRVHEVGAMEEMGVYADPYVNVEELIDWKDGVVDRLTGGVGDLLAANGVTVVDGVARFVDEQTAAVAPNGTDDADRIEFDHAIVATGSQPIELPGFSFDAEPIYSSRDLLSMGSVPNRVLVIGAGYIGMELSTVLAKLGTDVTVIEALDSALPGFEDDLGRIVRKRAQSLGIEFQFGEAAQGWEGAEGDLTVTTETDAGTEASYDADLVLAAVGRRPVADTVDPDAAGIALTDKGFVETDEYGETTTGGIYAVGDVAGEPMLAHEASHAGVAVAETIASGPTAVDPAAVPAAVFTDPEIATAGYTEADADAAGYDVTTGRFPFAASGRAMTSGHEDGFVRVVVDDTDGRILGAQVVGDHASELVAELGLAVSNGLTIEAVAETVHTHPTLSEAVKEACEHALGRAIHTSNR